MNAEQDEVVRKYIRQRIQHPGKYNVVDRNCADFVTGALRAAGFKPPWSPISDPASLTNFINGLPGANPILHGDLPLNLRHGRR
jgi:hypothetical protein